MARRAVRSTLDAIAFHDRVRHLIGADPIRYSILASNLARELARPDPAGAALWFWVEGTDGNLTSAGMHTPPHSPLVPGDDPEDARGIADHLFEQQRQVDGVVGSLAGTDAFARRWVELRPSEIATEMSTGVYELAELIEPRPTAGAARPTTAADEPLIQDWFGLFCDEIGVPRSDARTVQHRMSAGGMWAWELAGEVVSCTHSTPPSGGVVRVGFVYTPPVHRSHGYASALVARVSAEAQALGHRCMLYTDLANPTSNKIYVALGYRRVGSNAVLRFDPR